MSHLYCNNCGGRDIKKSTIDYYEVTKEDINKGIIKFQGRGHSYPGGHVITQDIGKRLYFRNNLAYMESQEQFERRIQSC